MVVRLTHLQNEMGGVQVRGRRAVACLHSGRHSGKACPPAHPHPTPRTCIMLMPQCDRWRARCGSSTMSSSSSA